MKRFFLYGLALSVCLISTIPQLFSHQQKVADDSVPIIASDSKSDNSDGASVPLARVNVSPIQNHVSAPIPNESEYTLTPQQVHVNPRNHRQDPEYAYDMSSFSSKGAELVQLINTLDPRIGQYLYLFGTAYVSQCHSPPGYEHFEPLLQDEALISMHIKPTDISVNHDMAFRVEEFSRLDCDKINARLPADVCFFVVTVSSSALHINIRITMAST